MANPKEIEDKLDEDFLFYLGFTTGLVNKFADREEFGRCQAWLQKLVGQHYTGVDEKRNRNIYLSQLVLCVEEGQLTEPFLRNPKEVDISDAPTVFGPAPCEVGEPAWLQDVVRQSGPRAVGEGDSTGDGRTYLATRTLPNGQGAFAYLAVTLAEEEPKWLGGGEGIFDSVLQRKFAEKVPPRTELEAALARRKDPEQIQRVIAFYDGVLQNIAEEMENLIKEEDNKTVNGLVEQLINDLKNKDQFCALEKLPDKQRRTELLMMLHDRVRARKNVIIKREDALDDLEKSMLPESFFEYSMAAQDKVSFPAAMWEAVIDKEPSKKNMNLLQTTYPAKLVDKFVELLSNEKEEIAVRMQRRHESIVSQMKKELRKEAEKGQKWVDEAKDASDQFFAILVAVRAQREKRDKVLEERAKRIRGGITETTTLYEQMRRALFETQRNVENEAEYGRHLAAQINATNAQTEQIQQVTNDAIMKVESANMQLMRNIKKLRLAIQQYENRIKQIQAATEETLKGKDPTRVGFIEF